MIVLDASAIVELIVEPSAATGALRARLQADPDIHVPHLVDAEVTNALRRKLLAGQLDILRARRAIRRLAVMRLVRWQQTPLLGRALALRHQLSAYDAIYVAMAEVTGATLLTRDGRLARAAGHRARVELVSPP
jgi:predicted nucleic acid-binding protein